MNKEIVLMYEMIFFRKKTILHMFSNKSPASSNSLLITSPLTCVVVVINKLFITKKTNAYNTKQYRGTTRK